MRESEETYYGSDMDSREERFIQMQSERSPAAEQRMGAKKAPIHPCINRALSGRHLLLIGATGSGKTYAAAYMSRFAGCFIFINTQSEKSVTDVCQISLGDPSDLQDALEEGYRRIEFVPSMDRDEACDEVQVIREELFEVGKEMKEQANTLELPFWITCFLDEVQIYSPKHTHKDGEIFWTRGRGFGIKAVAISRSPTEISSEVINNCEYELIFQLGHYSDNYFISYKIPIKEHTAWLARKHHFLLYDKINMFECTPVK